MHMFLTSHFPCLLYKLDYKLDLIKNIDTFFFNSLEFKLNYAKVMAFL